MEQLNLFDNTMETFKINKKIRLIELFAGIGSQAMALRDLGADFEHHRVVEFDKFAIKSYNAIHGTTFESIDITQISGSDLGITDTDKYDYVLTYSFPCVTSGTLVKTNDGYKPIEEIQVGDKVLTHKNLYKKVLKTMSRESNHINHVIAAGVSNLHITDEHPLYVLRDEKEQWIKCKDLQKGDFLSFNYLHENKDTIHDEKILWLLGRYVADGHINKYTYNSVNFSISLKKEDEFLKHCPDDFLGRFKKFKKTGIWDYRIADSEFQEACAEFGMGATNKRIPQWVFELSNDKKKAFIEGYFSGDGHIRETRPQTLFCTVSHELFCGLQMLICDIYGTICSCYIRKDSRKETFNDTYNGQFTINSKHSIFKRIGNKIFSPIRKINREEKTVMVYNIEVEDDNSYTCENVIVHNCQDLSVAGKQKGMTKGSGTRSGLLWEVERLLNEVDTLPQVLLMENVPQVHSKKNMSDFEKWINFLEGKGYSNHWQDLNAKNYGVAQNRNRTFMVSLLGKYSFKFPEPIPLERTMKDYLENEVEEKYYINTEKAEKLIRELVASGKLDEPKVCVDLSTNKPNRKNVANCITAHMSKDGNTISNRMQEGNGVVEWR